MTWSWDEIEQDWLSGGAVAETPDAAVDAFERVETYFGREWLEAGRTQKSAAGPIVIRGSSPTLTVLVLGKQLAVLESASDCGKVVSKLRVRDSSAYAELAAMWLVGDGERIRLECEPAVLTARRLRKPDFRVKPEGHPWTYVEVTRPNPAAAKRPSSAR